MLRLLRDVVGIDRVVFGTDFPYLRRDIALRCRQDIEASPELTDYERTAVLGATATKPIPRLATSAPRLRPTHHDATPAAANLARDRGSEAAARPGDEDGLA